MPHIPYNIILLLLAAILTACSGDDVVSGDNGQQTQHAIAIETWQDNGGDTRSTSVIADSILKEGKTLGLWAYHNDTKQNYIDGAQYTYAKKDEWGTMEWKAKETYYWTQGALDFYALFTLNYPDKVPGIDYSNMAKDKTVRVQLWDEYEYKKEPDSVNYDIMYATATNQTYNAQNPTVALQFKHMLSQIRLYLKNNTSTLDIHVKEVKFCNLLQYGTYHLDTGQWDLQDWSQIESNKIKYRMKQYDSGKYLHIQQHETACINDDKPFLVIPNTLPAWDPATDGKPVEKGVRYHGYVSISCYIYYNSNLIWGEGGGTTAKPKELYIPVGGTWEAGKRHNIYVNIEDAYTSIDIDNNKVGKHAKDCRFKDLIK